MPESTVALTPAEEELLAIARRVAAESPDRSRKVGAVLLGEQGRILTTGFNTLPDGVEHLDRFLERPGKYLWTEHAERNAIYEAARCGHATGGGSMFLPWFPCMPCARAIVQAGVKRVVAQAPDLSDPTYGPEFREALDLFQRTGVRFDPCLDASSAPKARADHDPAPTERPDGPSVAELVASWNERHVPAVRRRVRP